MKEYYFNQHTVQLGSSFIHFFLFPTHTNKFSYYRSNRETIIIFYTLKRGRIEIIYIFFFAGLTKVSCFIVGKVFFFLFTNIFKCNRKGLQLSGASRLWSNWNFSELWTEHLTNESKRNEKENSKEYKKIKMLKQFNMSILCNITLHVYDVSVLVLLSRYNRWNVNNAKNDLVFTWAHAEFCRMRRVILGRIGISLYSRS